MTAHTYQSGPDPEAGGRLTPKQRNAAAQIMLLIGAASVIGGLLTAFGGFGLIFLLFAPLWFILAAILRPTRWRVAAALFVMGCWAFGAFHVLT